MVNQASTRFKGDTHPAQCQNQQCQKRRVWKRSRKTVNLKLSRWIRGREGGREGRKLIGWGLGGGRWGVKILTMDIECRYGAYLYMSVCDDWTWHWQALQDCYLTKRVSRRQSANHYGLDTLLLIKIQQRQSFLKKLSHVETVSNSNFWRPQSTT